MSFYTLYEAKRTDDAFGGIRVSAMTPNQEKIFMGASDQDAICPFVKLSWEDPITSIVHQAIAGVMMTGMQFRKPYLRGWYPFFIATSTMNSEDRFFRPNLSLPFLTLGEAYVMGDVFLANNADGSQWRPVEGVRVSVVGAGGYFTYTGNNGRFYLIVPPGHITLLFEKPGYISKVIELFSQHGQSYILDDMVLLPGDATEWGNIGLHDLSLFDRSFALEYQTMYKYDRQDEWQQGIYSAFVECTGDGKIMLNDPNETGYWRTPEIQLGDVSQINKFVVDWAGVDFTSYELFQYSSGSGWASSSHSNGEEVTISPSTEKIYVQFDFDSETQELEKLTCIFNLQEGACRWDARFDYNGDGFIDNNDRYCIIDNEGQINVIDDTIRDSQEFSLSLEADNEEFVGDGRLLHFRVNNFIVTTILVGGLEVDANIYTPSFGLLTFSGQQRPPLFGSIELLTAEVSKTTLSWSPMRNPDAVITSGYEELPEFLQADYQQAGVYQEVDNALGGGVFPDLYLNIVNRD